MKDTNYIKTIGLTVLGIALLACGTVTAVNHFKLSKDGTIKPKIDSPYYLTEPSDLITFLQQEEYMTMVNDLHDKLIEIKDSLLDKLKAVNSYTIDYMQDKQCVKGLFMEYKDVYNSVRERSYMDRINPNEILNLIDSNWEQTYNQPYCDIAYPNEFSMFYYEHLESSRKRVNLRMDPEEFYIQELGIDIASLGNTLTMGLEQFPESWKLHTLSSYYWRFKGNAPRAIECARRAILLAPSEYKDIPLLSLGTIFQRTNQTKDAVVITEAALGYAPNVPENLEGFANSLFLVSNFNQSLRCYAKAEMMSRSYKNRVKFLRDSITCFKFFKDRVVGIQKAIEQMKIEMVQLNEGRQLLSKYKAKIMDVQVPLTLRNLDEKFSPQIQDMATRAQRCVARNNDASDEDPNWDCDLFTTTMLKLQFNSFELIEGMIQNAITTRTQLLQSTSETKLGIYLYLDLDNFSGIHVLKNFSNPSI